MPDNQTHSQTNPQAPKQVQALTQLNVFTGEWNIKAFNGEQSIGHARTVFTWLENGAFLHQFTNAEEAEFPASTSIIGCDDTTGNYSVLYSDVRGVYRLYQMSFTNNVWKQWRDNPGFSQRFTGTLSSDHRTIKARWEKSSDGSHWETDFDLIYTKVS